MDRSVPSDEKQGIYSLGRALIISERISSGDLVILKENSWGLSESQCLILGRRRSVLPPPAIGLTITNIFILFSIDVLYHRIYHLLHLPLPFCQLRI